MGFEVIGFTVLLIIAILVVWFGMYPKKSGQPRRVSSKLPLVEKPHEKPHSSEARAIQGLVVPLALKLRRSNPAIEEEALENEEKIRSHEVEEVPENPEENEEEESEGGENEDEENPKEGEGEGDENLEPQEIASEKEESEDKLENSEEKEMLEENETLESEMKEQEEGFSEIEESGETEALEEESDEKEIEDEEADKDDLHESEKHKGVDEDEDELTDEKLAKTLDKHEAFPHEHMTDKEIIKKEKGSHYFDWEKEEEPFKPENFLENEQKSNPPEPEEDEEMR